MKECWWLRAVPMALLPTLLCVFLVYGAGCTSTTAEMPASLPQVVEDSLPGRQALLERFFESQQLLVVVGAPDSLTEQAYVQMAGRGPGRWRPAPTVRRAGEVIDLSSGAALLVGTPRSNTHLTRLSPSLPVSFDGSGFTFAGVRYDDPTDVITLVFPNPDNPDFPLFLVSGNRDDQVAIHGQGIARMYDYQIVRAGKRIRLGHFSQQPGRRWTLEPAQDFDLLHSAEPVAEAGPLRILAPAGAFDAARLDTLTRGRLAVLDRLGDLLQTPLAGPIPYHIYTGLQQKALVTDNMDLAHVDAAGDVHVALQDDIALSGEAASAEAAALLVKHLGAPAHQAVLDGLRIVLAGNWHGQHARAWAGRIAAAGLAPSLDDLLDNARYEAYPAFLREPVAAELASLLLEAGPEWETHYREGIPPSERGPMDAGLLERLNQAAAEAPALRASGRPAPEHYKGFNFAHEGYGIINGYGSRSATDALVATQHLGANAVAIIPYTFINDPNTPHVLPIPTSAGSENDASVIHAALQARRLGLHVSIKPQIWLRGGWPGDIEMFSEADWDTFFQHYARWIGHYAVMAQLYDLDLLTVGTELSRATIGHEDRWREMVSRWRNLFAGSMVYASNWGEEFENLSFWDAFEYIAVNVYYPLSDKDAPTDRELRKGAESVLDRLEQVHRRHQMPILITEIGYPSTMMPWKSPWLENREMGVFLEDQARCYEAMCRALDGHTWLRGTFWWKWPSYLERGGPDERGFTPNGKPAADVLADWFETW